MYQIMHYEADKIIFKTENQIIIYESNKNHLYAPGSFGIP